MEDALVLAEELEHAASVEMALAGFIARRYGQCSLLVDNSMGIGRCEQVRAPIEQQTAFVEQSLKVLSQAI